MVAEACPGEGRGATIHACRAAEKAWMPTPAPGLRRGMLRLGQALRRHDGVGTAGEVGFIADWYNPHDCVLT